MKGVHAKHNLFQRARRDAAQQNAVEIKKIMTADRQRAAVGLDFTGEPTAIAGDLWLCLFLLIVNLVVGRSISSALFLHAYDGRALALLYILVGVAVAAVVRAIGRIGAGLSSYATNRLTLGAFFLVVGAAAVC